MSSYTSLGLSPLAAAALNEEFSAKGVNSSVASSVLTAAASGKQQEFPAASIDVKQSSDILKVIIEGIHDTIQSVNEEYKKSANRRNIAFKCIIGFMIFAAACIAITMVLDITGALVLSKGITAANAIVSLPAGIGLSVYAFQSKDNIDVLRNDLIRLYEIQGRLK